VGIVNFTVLHSLLHVIVNQLDLGDCNVEFRGSDSERLQNYISTAKPGPIITLTEYTVGPDGKGRKKKAKKGSKRSSVVASSGSLQTIVVVEPASKEKIGDSPKFTIALTKEQLGKLQKDLKDLQKQVKELTDLPGNIGLIDAIRTSKDGGTSPILDMFQILTLVKRLDATEVAMNKMASMIEDLAKGQSSLAEPGNKQERKLSFKDQSQDLVTKSQELRRSLDGTVGGSNQIQELINELKELEQRITQLENQSAAAGPLRRESNLEGSNSQSAAKSTKGKKKAGQDADKDSDDSEERNEGGDTEFDSTDLSTLSPQNAIALLQAEIIRMKEANNMANQIGVEALKQVESLKESLISDEKEKNLPPDMDIKINDLKEQVSTLDTVYHQQFSNVNDRLEQLDKEISALWERINSGLPGGDASAGANGQNIQEVYNKLLQLQDDMNALSETANKLAADREGRQDSLDVMIEQIELLKTVKADREDLEDALADKADACQINRKVSHEQFDAAYDEITKSLENTLEKLRQQEELWVQSLNDLQKEIGNKLDKMELTPLKDFINSKLKGIQDKVKKISALKQEHEAAGTKSKLLRNVNCISCDADVVMKKQTDITMFPKPYASPATKSPGPYLAYELDLLRKQQKSLANGKNLNMLESALQTGKLKTLDKDHLCNRYCGGSHTITTPEQRVMRVGHFMEQWGPEISPVNEVLIKGTDGHLYKGRDDAALRAAAVEKAPTPRMETPALTISGYNLGNNNTNTASNISQKEVKQDKSEMKQELAQSGSRTVNQNNNTQNNANNKPEEKTSHDSANAKRPKTSAPELGRSSEMRRSSVKSADIKPN
ncbi:hypothetical protein D910_08006, partial [Dendroctonus ponderosae]